MPPSIASVYEYHVETVSPGALDVDRLNVLGADRWEFVALRIGGDTDQLIFKREQR